MTSVKKMESRSDQPSGWTNEELPPPGRPHMWFFGGCGFLLLLVGICALGTVLMTTKFGQTDQTDFVEESKLLLKSSPTVIEYLGEPIEADPQSKVEFTQGGDDESQTMIEITLIGSQKTGIAKIRGSFEDGVYIRGKTTLEVDGKIIPLNLDEELIPEIEIDLGIDLGID